MQCVSVTVLPVVLRGGADCSDGGEAKADVAEKSWRIWRERTTLEGDGGRSDGGHGFANPGIEKHWLEVVHNIRLGAAVAVSVTSAGRQVRIIV